MRPTRWTMFGIPVVEMHDPAPILHLGVTNYNDGPFGPGRRGMSICGIRITTEYHHEDSTLARCLKCRMIISDYFGDDSGDSGGT